MIDQLLKYNAIAWDFDGTLIDHPRSALMHEFIIRQPKRHSIVTFRTHGYQNDMFREMRQKYPDSPGPEHFADVKNIADKAWEKYTEADRLRVFLQFDGPLTPWEEYYLEWKGMICRQLNLPILVDDMRAHVLRGCEKYNVDYIHPDEL